MALAALMRRHDGRPPQAQVWRFGMPRRIWGLRDPLQQRRAQLFHGRQRLAVHILRSVRSRIMADRRWPRSGARLSKTPAKASLNWAQADVRRSRSRPAQCGASGKRTWIKGKLHSYGMFLLVQGFVGDAMRIGGQQGVHHLFIDHRYTERCAEAVPGIDGNFPEKIRSYDSLLRMTTTS